MFHKFHSECIVVGLLLKLIRVYVILEFFNTIIRQMQFCVITRRYYDFHINAVILASHIEIIKFIIEVLPKFKRMHLSESVSKLIRDFVNSTLCRTIMVQI